MKTRLANAEDVRTFEYDGDEAKIMEAFDWRRQLATYLSIGPAWIFENDGAALVFAGYFQLSPGVLQVWMLFNEDAKHSAKSLVKEFKRILAEAMQKKDVHRIQTLIDEAKIKDASFAALIGFEYEATLEAFGPRKEDVMIYKMVKRCS
jgi:hypothetical protein